MLHESPEFRHFRSAFAENKAPLAIILGAGLSAPAGLPTWKELEKKLLDDVHQRIRGFTEIEQQLKKGLVAALNQATDPWLKFQLIKNLLGPATFESSVQEHLSPGDDEEVPRNYLDLLRLNPNSFISLNLDRFAGEATTKVVQKFLSPIYGKELVEKWGSYVNSHPSLIYLHGDILNPSTWVMTKTDLDNLLASDGHRQFLESVYLNNLVLLVGLGARDSALSIPLLRLTNAGFRPPNVFWLTDTRHLGHETQEWADTHHVRLIRYDAAAPSDHTHSIIDFVERCRAHRPQDTLEKPLHNANIKSAPSMSPDHLAELKPEQIRKHVAAAINHIIDNSKDEELYSRYRAFCADNDFALHQSFYRKNFGHEDVWFGYRLSLPAIGRGNFGEVYSATNDRGDLVAVKIMNREAFLSDEMLGGFRRGVRSMQHVSEGSVDGMIDLIEAYELPPTIVMPFVSGQSLQQILDNEYDLSWLTCLKIVTAVGMTVSKAHALPATVMHRDLKPSNIMLRDYPYQANFNPDVVVLDFDMSWHKGAKEKDVVFESRDDFGYLAPEQTIYGGPYHSRNTKVDTYGLGMTAYALFGGITPLANEPLNSEWPHMVAKACNRNYNLDWKSAPARLARTIVYATVFDQARRLDFFRFVRRLRTLLLCLEDPTSVDDADAWGEEILSRMNSMISYEWDDESSTGKIETPTRDLILEADSVNRLIEVRLEYVDQGMLNRATVGSLMKENQERAARVLESAGWSSIRSTATSGSFSVSATVGVEDVRRSSDMIDGLNKAFASIRL